MNSSQRRKTKREHPYRVSLFINSNEMYYAFDARVVTAKSGVRRNAQVVMLLMLKRLMQCLHLLMKKMQ
jgi:hypothetical protein